MQHSSCVAALITLTHTFDGCHHPDDEEDEDLNRASSSHRSSSSTKVHRSRNLLPDLRTIGSAQDYRGPLGSGVHFPTYLCASNPSGMMRVYGSPGSVGGKKDGGWLYLKTLNGLGCPVVRMSTHFKQFNRALFQWIMRTKPAIPGFQWPVPKSKKGDHQYLPAEMTLVLDAVIMCGRSKGGWVAPSVQELLVSRQPTVRLYRNMQISNEAAPGCVAYIRAYPFRGQEFRGRTCDGPREDCIFAVPEDSDPATYELHPKADGTWVGRVICFFTALVRDGADTCGLRRLAFVHWAEPYPSTTRDRESVLEQWCGTSRVYWPAQPWYQVIPCSFILGMEHMVPDFANEGVVPSCGPKGLVGCKLQMRNPLARNFGRPKPGQAPVLPPLQGLQLI